MVTRNAGDGLISYTAYTHVGAHTSSPVTEHGRGVGYSYFPLGLYITLESTNTMKQRREGRRQVK